MILTPELKYNSKEPLYMQLRHYVVNEIAENRLATGERLPSVRKLASHLGLSRNSIENAYNQLLAEGYIESRDRAGYYVAEIESFSYQRSNAFDTYAPKEEAESAVYDFKSEYVSEDNFDFRLWKKHLNHIINYEADKLYAYGSMRGDYTLREAISRYFHRSRGVVASPDNIVIGGGVSPLLTMLSKLFDVLGIESIGMENPGFNKAKGIFEYSRMQVVPVDVNRNGISINELRKTNARLCYVSPSHQFPTGYVMPVKNRQQLLNWATDMDGFIIEDDYNSELRFEGRPIPAMQAMDSNDRVIYLGSFSTVLAPAIRVSFMVLPAVLNQLLEGYKDLFSQSASILEQLALARLIDSGDFERHIRRIRKNYAKKQQDVLKLIEKHLPDDANPSYGKSGLQMLIHLSGGLSESEVVEACKKHQVLLSGIGDYLMNEVVDREQQLVLSYRGIDETHLEEGIEIIGAVIHDLAGYVSMGEGI